MRHICMSCTACGAGIGTGTWTGIGIRISSEVGYEPRLMAFGLWLMASIAAIYEPQHSLPAALLSC